MTHYITFRLLTLPLSSFLLLLSDINPFYLSISLSIAAPDENDGDMSHNLQTVIDSFRELHQYASLRRPSKSKRYSRKRPQLFGHKRSHSAGNAIVFAVRTPTEPTPPILNSVVVAATTPAASSSSSGGGGVGAFQATKNFLKRLYQSTTSREASTTAAANKNNIGDGGTDTTTSSVDSGYHGSDRFAPTLPSVPSLAVAETDFASSSPPLSPPPRPGPGLAGREFKSWNDVFDHLRREIASFPQTCQSGTLEWGGGKWRELSCLSIRLLTRTRASFSDRDRLGGGGYLLAAAPN